MTSVRFDFFVGAGFNPAWNASYNCPRNNEGRTLLAQQRNQRCGHVCVPPDPVSSAHQET